MPDLHELMVTAGLPIFVTAVACAAQNLAQRDNAWKSLFGGLVCGIVTVICTYVGNSLLGGVK